MKTDFPFSSTSRFLITAAAFVVLIAGMRAAEALLVPFLLAMFITVIVAPFLFWLQSKGLPQGPALLLVIFTLVLCGVLLVDFVGTSINDFSASMPAYSERLNQDITTLQIKLSSLGIKIPDNITHDVFDPAIAMKLVGRLFSSISAMLANTFFILLTVIFILFEISSFTEKLQLIFKDPATSLGKIHSLGENLNRYVVIKTLISLITGVVISIYLAIIGVDFPILWGLLAFFFNFVPNIGSIIAAVPAVLLAFVQSGIDLALLTIGGYVALNVIVGSIIEPRVMGRGVGLSTLVVFLSLVFWGWVLGPVGMLLSVPLTMMVKVALESDENTHWLSILLGTKSNITPSSDKASA